MALIPIPIRRRLRDSGFSEEQTNALDEASEATANAAREGLAKRDDVRDEYYALRSDIQQLRSEMQRLRSDMSALAWRLFAAVITAILAATAAIMTAIAVWG